VSLRCRALLPVLQCGVPPRKVCRAGQLEVRLPGPSDSSTVARFHCSEGGFFKALLKFPEDFPNHPPEMVFTSAVWHPNSALASRRDWWPVSGALFPPLTSTGHPPTGRTPLDAAVYPDGKVCISILHTPGVDAFNEFESADERWRPIIGIEQVLVSVMAMLGEPNLNSPANIDAAVSGRQAC
jgi:ubiquitin-protein ligase